MFNILALPPLPMLDTDVAPNGAMVSLERIPDFGPVRLPPVDPSFWNTMYVLPSALSPQAIDNELRSTFRRMDEAYEQSAELDSPAYVEAEIARLERRAADLIRQKTERELKPLREERALVVAAARALLGKE